LLAENRKKPGRKLTFPWDSMAVGDTFTVENRTVRSFTGTMAYANESRAPKRFRSKTIGDNIEIRRVK